MSRTIRVAEVADAQDVAALAAEFHAYLRSLGDDSPFHFNAETYRRDGFGADPAFGGFVAEVDREVAGYLLHHGGYDTDASRRLLYVIDLYVRPSHRGRGLGHALMEAAAAAARARGATDLVWTVYAPNVEAKAFYERIGARQPKDTELMVLPVRTLVSPARGTGS